MYPPDGLLTLGDSKHDVDLNPHIIEPDPFDKHYYLDAAASAYLPLLTTTQSNTMNTGDDESPSGLNGRLRPRKVHTPQKQTLKVSRKSDGKSSQDRPKRTCTPSKAPPNKPDDLDNKADLFPTAQLLCAYCDKKFASKQTLSKHIRRVHLLSSKQDLVIDCLFCNHSDNNAAGIMRHMVDNHPNQYFACLDCHTRFASTSDLAEHKLNVCNKQYIIQPPKLRQKQSAAVKKNKKSVVSDQKEEFKELQEGHNFNGIVISCELKPSQIRNEEDIEDNITTNLILPSNKRLGQSTALDKSAVIVLDDIQWNKRIPHNFSFHNTDTDQILSRLGVVHRSPRSGESTRKEWRKSFDDTTQKFERCFDTTFYSRVASNVQENLSKFLDGSFNFNPDPDSVIKTRKSKNNVVINTAEGFPILLAYEQYSRSVFDGYIPRSVAPKYKWKWDNLENDKNIMDPSQIKRDSHTNSCIITLVSSLDIWTQLRMRRKYDDKFGGQPIEKKTEKQHIIGKELKEILESREIPTSSQVVKYKTRSMPSTEKADFPACLGLVPVPASYDVKPAVLSGEWVRPRCYVCCACGAQTRDPRALTLHMSAQHPNAHVQHYEIVGERLLDSDILKHLYVPPSQMSNRTRPLRGIKECTKCKKTISLEEIHQHMLDCAGDMPTVRRRQCRYRPFGVRRRRTRMPDNTVRKKIRKDIRNRQRRQKNHIRPRQKIRTEVGDAETIRKMLADLPAKRHRVMLNPINQMSRPRRVLERQRNKIVLKRRLSLDSKRDLRSSKDTPSTTSQAANTNKTKENDEDDEDNKPLKSKVPNVVRTRRSQSLNTRTTLKRSKRMSIRLREQRMATSDKTESPKNVSTSTEPQKQSLGKPNQKIDVKNASFKPRQHGNRNGANNRDDQRAGCSGPNGNQNNAHAPTQNVPLKHSIARLTADSETHDKSVQFHHLFLVQQECNNASQHMPSGQLTLFENEGAESRLDKPPLSYDSAGIMEFYSLQRNKRNKPRKGLNACIAMLKNKLTDPNPSSALGHISVKCGSDEPIDMELPMPTLLSATSNDKTTLLPISASLKDPAPNYEHTISYIDKNTPLSKEQKINQSEIRTVVSSKQEMSEICAKHGPHLKNTCEDNKNKKEYVKENKHVDICPEVTIKHVDICPEVTITPQKSVEISTTLSSINTSSFDFCNQQRAICDMEVMHNEHPSSLNFVEESSLRMQSNLLSEYDLSKTSSVQHNDVVDPDEARAEEDTFADYVYQSSGGGHNTAEVITSQAKHFVIDGDIPPNIMYSESMSLSVLPTDIPPAHASTNVESIIAAPLDLSAKIINTSGAVTEQSYLSNYDEYETLDLSNKKFDCVTADTSDDVVDLSLKSTYEQDSFDRSFDNVPTDLSLKGKYSNMSSDDTDKQVTGYSIENVLSGSKSMLESGSSVSLLVQESLSDFRRDVGGTLPYPPTEHNKSISGDATDYANNYSIRADDETIFNNHMSTERPEYQLAKIPVSRAVSDKGIEKNDLPGPSPSNLVVSKLSGHVVTNTQTNNAILFPTLDNSSSTKGNDLLVTKDMSTVPSLFKSIAEYDQNYKDTENNDSSVRNSESPVLLKPITNASKINQYQPVSDKQSRISEVNKSKPKRRDSHRVIKVPGEQHDLETAKKIAMLPKELVEILGSMPEDHRKQLLNVLPQYVSSTTATTTQLESTHTYSTANLLNQTTSSSVGSGKHFVNVDNMTKSSESESSSILASQCLRQAQSLDLSPNQVQLNNQYSVCFEEKSSLSEKLSDENSVLNANLLNLNKCSDKVIDLTEDENLSIQKHAEKSAESNLFSHQKPSQELQNYKPVVKSVRQKVNNEQTASLRAVRIKTPSERHKDNPLLKRMSEEQTSLSGNLKNNDENDTTRLSQPKIFLAIQQAEISSTQHGNKHVVINALKENELITDNLKVQFPIFTDESTVKKQTQNSGSDIPVSSSILSSEANLNDTLNDKNSNLLDVTNKAKLDAPSAVNISDIEMPKIINEDNSPTPECALKKEVEENSLHSEKKDSILEVICMTAEQNDDNLKKDGSVEKNDLITTDQNVAMLSENSSTTESNNITTDSDNPKITSVNDEDSDDDVSLALIIKQRQKSVNSCSTIVFDTEKFKNDDVSKNNKKKRKERKCKVTHKPIVCENLSENKDLILENGEVESDHSVKEKQQKKKSKRNILTKKENKCEKLKGNLNSDGNDNINDVIMESEILNRDIDDHISRNLGETTKMTNITLSKAEAEENDQTVKPIDFAQVEHTPVHNELQKNKNECELKGPYESTSLSCETGKENKYEDLVITKNNVSIHNTLNQQQYSEIIDRNVNDEKDTKEDNTNKKSVRTKKSKHAENSGANENTPTHENDDDATAPLRRSRRGKSLYIESNSDSNYQENSSAQNSIESTEPLKAPFTKKQLIFSKLLLDVESHRSKNIIEKEQKDEVQPDINERTEIFQGDSIDNNILKEVIEHHSTANCISPEVVGEKTKIATDNVEINVNNEILPITKKSKLRKRKKSPQSKKSKKKKSLDISKVNIPNSEAKDDQPNSSTESEYIEQKNENEYTTVVKNRELESVMHKGTKCISNTINNLSGDSLQETAVKTPLNKNILLDQIKPPTSDKRKKDVDNSQVTKPKKSKLSVTLVDAKSKEETEQSAPKTCDNLSVKIEDNSPAYNAPVAARRTRSKSVLVKPTYDPYDIDQDDMNEKTEPFRKAVVKVPRKGKSKLLISGTEDNLDTSTAIQSNADKKNNGISETPKKKYRKISEPQSNNLNKPDTTYKANEVIEVLPGIKGSNGNMEDNANDSDESSKSDVPLQKYIKDKKLDHGKDKNKINEKTNQPTDEKTCQENTVEDNSNEAAERIRSEKFMASFGFFSERKPRKSNLIASKKISETFHIIANESDDVYFRTKDRNTKKSNQQQNEDTKKETKKRGRKKKNSTSSTCYCQLCKKAFRRPDNYLRHQLSLYHIAKLCEVELKIKTVPIPEEPNYLIAFKEQLDRLKILTNKLAKGKKKTKITLPTLEEILVEVHRSVREQQLARRNLSKDEALFLDCCELLKKSRLDSTFVSDVNKIIIPAQASTSQLASAPENIRNTNVDSKSDGDVDSITAKSILESEEVRNLENCLLSGLKEAGNVNVKHLECHRNDCNAGTNETSCSSTIPVDVPSVEKNDCQEQSVVSEKITTKTNETGSSVEPGQISEHAKVSQVEKPFEDSQSQIESNKNSVTDKEVGDKTLVKADTNVLPVCNDAEVGEPSLKEKQSDTVDLEDSKKDLVQISKDITQPQTERKKILIDIKTSKDNETLIGKKSLSEKVEDEVDLQKFKKPMSEVKELMYPEPDIDLFEDKFDKIKRKCRSQAAAAKQTQTVVEIRHKEKKKSDKKKIKRGIKKAPQHTILTKGALKGFDGIKVSIPTSDLNISAIVPRVESLKKKRKSMVKKKKEKKDSESNKKYDTDFGVKEGSSGNKKVDVYEFMDNEDAELFEFRPSTLMERFKSISSKERQVSKVDAADDEYEGNSSDSDSDEDDFVYMSDGYPGSDIETEQSETKSETSNGKDAKKSSQKRRDAVEKNAVMGKIFKHNAVRTEKRNTKTRDTPKQKPNLDQLFDSLLVGEPVDQSSKEDKPTENLDVVKSNKDDSPPRRDNPEATQNGSETDDDEMSTSKADKSNTKTDDYGPSTSKQVTAYDCNSTNVKYDNKEVHKTTYSEEDKLNYDPPTCKKTIKRTAIHLPSIKTFGSYEESLLLKRGRSLDEHPPNEISSPVQDRDSYDYIAESDLAALDDTGVARQRARRKCTVGKQNVLTETWSSESEPDGARSGSAESLAPGARKKRARRREGHQAAARRTKHGSGKKQDNESRVNSSSRSVSVSGADNGEGSRYRDEDEEEKRDSAAVDPYLSPQPGPSGLQSAGKARPRLSASYWAAEGEHEPEQPQQHGWIVGDSHKKLVTMLAHAKGRKRHHDHKRHLD